jgi:hypothetical protein
MQKYSGAAIAAFATYDHDARRRRKGFWGQGKSTGEGTAMSVGKPIMAQRSNSTLSKVYHPFDRMYTMSLAERTCTRNIV